jgi:NADH-quinone oxidoreductase subunit M
MSTFVSEILVLIGTYQRYPAAAVVATLAIVLAALYALIWFQRVATGPETDRTKGFKDLRGREMLAVVPVTVLILALGFYPKPVLEVINPAVSTTLEQVGVRDPEPTVVPPAAAEGVAP